MRGKSHHQLGEYLIEQYLPQLPNHYRKAFLIGCVEPDRNPLTYLKGSGKYALLRGHNYHNAKRYMHRLSHRLERRKHWNLWDYYSLGKLIHYTADAFTLAHNDVFSSSLLDHRSYEKYLQEQFLPYLACRPSVDIHFSGNVMQSIIHCHDAYLNHRPDHQQDMHYALKACCCVFALLFTCRIL